MKPPKQWSLTAALPAARNTLHVVSTGSASEREVETEANDEDGGDEGDEDAEEGDAGEDARGEKEEEILGSCHSFRCASSAAAAAAPCAMAVIIGVRSPKYSSLRTLIRSFVRSFVRSLE